MQRVLLPVLLTLQRNLSLQTCLLPCLTEAVVARPSCFCLVCGTEEPISADLSGALLHAGCDGQARPLPVCLHCRGAALQIGLLPFILQVSLFLQEGIQTPDGRVILHTPDSGEHTPPVGSVVTYAQSGGQGPESLPIGMSCCQPCRHCSQPVTPAPMV